MPSRSFRTPPNGSPIHHRCRGLPPPEHHRGRQLVSERSPARAKGFGAIPPSLSYLPGADRFRRHVHCPYLRENAARIDGLLECATPAGFAHTTSQLRLPFFNSVRAVTELANKKNLSPTYTPTDSPSKTRKHLKCTTRSAVRETKRYQCRTFEIRPRRQHERNNKPRKT